MNIKNLTITAGIAALATCLITGCGADPKETYTEANIAKLAQQDWDSEKDSSAVLTGKYRYKHGQCFPVLGRPTYAVGAKFPFETKTYKRNLDKYGLDKSYQTFLDAGIVTMETVGTEDTAIGPRLTLRWDVSEAAKPFMDDKGRICGGKRVFDKVVSMGEIETWQEDGVDPVYHATVVYNTKYTDVPEMMIKAFGQKPFPDQEVKTEVYFDDEKETWTLQRQERMKNAFGF